MGSVNLGNPAAWANRAVEGLQESGKRESHAIGKDGREPGPADIRMGFPGPWDTLATAPSPVALRVSHPPRPAAAATCSTRAGVRGDEGAHTPMKILIADDQLMCRRLARAALEPAGHEISEVDHGLSVGGRLEGAEPPPGQGRTEDIDAGLARPAPTTTSPSHSTRPSCGPASRWGYGFSTFERRWAIG